MKTFRHMAGYTLAQADEVRRDIGKKTGKFVLHKEFFINGAAERGYTPEYAAKIWDMIEKCQVYIFNKISRVCLCVHWVYLHVVEGLLSGPISGRLFKI